MLLRDAIAGVTLTDLGMRYSEGCWQAWKDGKTAALQSDAKPFLGGPSVLSSRGIVSLRLLTGDIIEVGPLTRLRLRQLRNEDLAQLGLSAFAGQQDGELGGQDVVHPEYVATFAENIANSDDHLMNNFLAASAALDALVSFSDENLTVEAAIDNIERALDGKNIPFATGLVAATRASWIGRACTDGSWKVSSDFKFHFRLDQGAADLDPYVVMPVLKQFVADLKSGDFGQTAQPSSASG